MIIKNGTKLNGIAVNSTSILPKGRVNPNITITPTSITVHNTSNPNVGAENHRKFLLNHNLATATGAETSWHFTVDDVSIIQHMDTAKMAYHAGSANKTSIGIELCEFDNATRQAKVYENAQVLIRYLMNQHKITKVYTHQHWTGKNCPRKILAGMGFTAFVNGIPKTITVNGSSTTATNTPSNSTSTPSNVATTVVDGVTFKATDNHYGVVKILGTKNDAVNIREKADLTSKVVQVTHGGDSWKAYGKVNGLYKLSEGKYITSNAKYVKFIDNPYLDDSGRPISTGNTGNTSSNVTSTTTTTKLVKIKVDNLFTYNSANWNDKGTIVNKNEVFTVVKELTVDGAKMYQLKSGKFLTANTKYVEII